MHHAFSSAYPYSYSIAKPGFVLNLISDNTITLLVQNVFTAKKNAFPYLGKAF